MAIISRFNMSGVRTLARMRTADRIREDRAKRYYAFRNTNRLKSLTGFRILFSILFWLSTVAITIGGGILIIWFFLGMFGLWTVSEWQDAFNLGLLILLAGCAVLLIMSTVRFLIERAFLKAERKELDANPEGADKYLEVIKVVKKIDIMNMVIWGVIIAAAVTCYFVKSPLLAGISIIVGILLLIIAQITTSVSYVKIKDYISEIKAERQRNKRQEKAARKEAKNQEQQTDQDQQSNPEPEYIGDHNNPFGG